MGCRRKRPTISGKWPSVSTCRSTVLSDAKLELAHAMRLPTMIVDGKTLLKRLTLVVKDGMVEEVFYPVFPPDSAATTVLEWLRAQG